MAVSVKPKNRRNGYFGKEIQRFEILEKVSFIVKISQLIGMRLIVFLLIL